jgi:purine-binding chemotaxis protein CheW
MMNEEEDSQQIVVFKLDNKLYGVNIGQIREITRMSEISPVPNAPSCIEGVTNLRGQVTTVINLRTKFGMPKKEYDKDSRMMIIESGGRSAGAIVDSVTEVAMIPKADIEQTPELTKSNQQYLSYLRGIGKKEDKLIILVDLRELLQYEQLSELTCSQ